MKREKHKQMHTPCCVAMRRGYNAIAAVKGRHCEYELSQPQHTSVDVLLQIRSCGELALKLVQCKSSCDSTVPQLCGGRCYSSAGAQHCGSGCGGGLCLNGGPCLYSSSTGLSKCAAFRLLARNHCVSWGGLLRYYSCIFNTAELQHGDRP